MIGKSLPEYIFIRICIFFLRLVAPASLFYISLCLYTRKFVLWWALPFAILEAGFFLFVYLPRKKRLQKVQAVLLQNSPLRLISYLNRASTVLLPSTENNEKRYS